MNRAVFLDRDGTINEDKGYVNHPDKVEIIPKVIPAIKRFRLMGFKFIIVTNQSGLARGFFSLPVLKKINSRVLALLAAGGAQIDDIYSCYHHPEGKIKKYAVDCECRKPMPGMALQAKKKYGLDLSNSYMIGDKISDIKFANNFGGKGIFILSGYGLGEWTYNKKKVLASKPAYVAKDMMAAASWVKADK